MKHPIRRRLMYLGFQGLRALVQGLPLWAIRALGRGMGLLAYGLLWDQRRLTMEHLAIAFGSTLTPAKRRRVARGVFQNLAQNALEWMWLPRCSTKELLRLTACEGIEHLRAALAQGNGAILVTAHFGNWEMITLSLTALGFKGAVLARRLRYSEYEAFLIALRGARGVPTLARGSLKEVATLLRANQIVGMLPDQDIDSLDGVFVNFFGKAAYTPVGPAALSVMTGSPIVPCVIRRDGTQFRLVVEPPLRAPQGVERVQAIRLLTQAWSEVIESYIRRDPDQWVWMHRRWKTQPHSAVPGPPATSAGAGNPQQGVSHPLSQTVVSTVLAAGCCVLAAVLAGCAKSSLSNVDTHEMVEAPSDPNAAQRMSEFTLTGYSQDGATRWTMNGQGAVLDGKIMTIRRPDATGYEPGRTAHLTASLAEMHQDTRHVRLEHDVTIHTSDGLWFTSSVLHWMPDQNRVATDQPVRIETDHMLLRGRGADGLTQLKQATILDDIELVLNPTDHAGPQAPAGGQVTITCDGPLVFDYEHHVATFEKHVHIRDPGSELYSDTLIAYLDEATRAIRYADAIGHVRIYENQNTAVSERAVYEPMVGTITLVGKPSLLIYPSGERGETRLSFGALIAAPGTPPASQQASYIP